MTEQDYRSLMVNPQIQYIGCVTDDARQRFLVDVYNLISPLPRGIKAAYGVAWCCIQQSAFVQMNQMKSIIPVEQGCWEFMNAAKSMGIWKSKSFRPQRGDFVMLDFPKDDGNGNMKRDGMPDHIEIIEAVGDNYMTLIGGNNTGHECSRQTYLLSDDNILGYIAPNYASLAGGTIIDNKPDGAKSYNKKIAGNYMVKTGLYLRSGPGSSNKAICVMPQGAIVQADGYYTKVNTTDWYHVKYSGIEGFCSSAYLKKV